MKRIAVAGALIAALLLSACSIRAGGSVAPSRDEGIEHPAGDAPVLHVRLENGFVAPTTRLVGLPSFLVTGDGRVFTLGAVAAVYPGPALPAVIVRQLSEEGLQALLRAVLDSHQFDVSAEWMGASSVVADAADTVFTLHADGREVAVRVYGLGTLEGHALPPGVTDPEREAHRALGELEQRLIGLISADDWLPAGAWLDEWHAYQPAALRMLVRNADNDEPEPSGIEGDDVAWPIPGDPATFGDETAIQGYRCGVATGTDADAFWDVLFRANELIRFVDSGHRYEVTARQLLPGEAEECPAA